MLLDIKTRLAQLCDLNIRIFGMLKIKVEMVEIQSYSNVTAFIYLHTKNCMRINFENILR